MPKVPVGLEFVSPTFLDALTFAVISLNLIQSGGVRWRNEFGKSF